MNGCTVVIVIALLILVFLWWWKSCRKEGFAGGNPGYYKITWDAPTDTGGSPISHYGVVITKKGSSTPISSGQPTTTEFDFGKGDTSDKPVGAWDTDYTVTITTVNGGGVTSDPVSYDFTSITDPSGASDWRYEVTSGGKIQAGDTMTDTELKVKIGESKPTDFVSSSIVITRSGSPPCAYLSNMTYDSSSGLWKSTGFSTVNPCNLGSYQAGDIVKASVTVNSDKYSDPTGYTVPTAQAKPSPPTNVKATWMVS